MAQPQSNPYSSRRLQVISSILIHRIFRIYSTSTFPFYWSYKAYFGGFEEIRGSGIDGISYDFWRHEI
jgi:hypothetical protein